MFDSRDDGGELRRPSSDKDKPGSRPEPTPGTGPDKGDSL